MTPEDIKRMMEAGASLVALNTGIRENGMRLLKAGAQALMPTPPEPVGPTETATETSQETTTEQPQ